MANVICKDFHGKTHTVNADDLINRLSAYGVYITNDKVLLIKDPRSNRWELPGGGVESNETILQALAREFLEETGVSPTGKISLLDEWVEYFFDVVGQQGWRANRKFFLIANIDNESKLLSNGNGEDSAGAEFIAIEKLETLHIAPSIKKVIEQAFANF